MDELPRTCGEEDLLRIPNEILDELTPEQICLTPTIVCAYTVLEQFGSKLKPGDSVLLNAAHLSASGSALLQLCKLLKLKPLCMLSLPGRAPIGSNRCFKGFVNFVMFDGLTWFNVFILESHHPSSFSWIFPDISTSSICETAQIIQWFHFVPSTRPKSQKFQELLAQVPRRTWPRASMGPNPPGLMWIPVLQRLPQCDSSTSASASCW